jgi:hypothetical protein
MIARLLEKRLGASIGEGEGVVAIMAVVTDVNDEPEEVDVGISIAQGGWTMTMGSS